MEVQRPEIDRFGYDLVVPRGAIVRHIQLKSGVRKRPASISISRSLAVALSGCVVYVHVDDALSHLGYRMFGGIPGKPLYSIEDLPASIRMYRTAGEASRRERQNHVDLPGGRLGPIVDLPTIAELLLNPEFDRRIRK